MVWMLTPTQRQKWLKGNYKVACLEMRKYCQVVIDTANKVKEMEEQNATGQVSEPVREVQ